MEGLCDDIMSNVSTSVCAASVSVDMTEGWESSSSFTLAQSVMDERVTHSPTEILPSKRTPTSHMESRIPSSKHP